MSYNDLDLDVTDPERWPRKDIANLLEACRRLLKFNEALCQDMGVSSWHPSADFARKVIAEAEGRLQ